ncbi:MAG: phosphotransferase [Candidatus Methanoperedens nitroreducens]|uniref:Phosphotransferase n=1 Tax=Candidatus Methanoperedens nitratireducens TaxID=1392998 RepID=A0A0P8A5M8_9EURY|nr:DHH family phosphoesterase [Candidatus Methanoperedens sp. BLZ2]KPQ43443.1 MAG: phosphotransferase [Candidatus Methanoperedens sp. BLZ1]MCX9079541.1 DHH family phosphoesterase [Candidatus Methanoperedens sp.]
MKPIKAIYAVLGSGGIGLALAKELETRTKNIILVDNDAAKVETLKEQNLNAVQGNIGDNEILSSLDIQNIESVFIMSSDIEANKKALNFIRKKAPDVQIVTRVNTYQEKEEMEAAGADLVVLPSNLPIKAIASAIVQYIEKMKSVKLAQDLKKLISTVGEGKLAIIVHDNPDPDAISSAMGLKEIANSVGVKAEILYRGIIGHHENKAFVNLLDIEMDQSKDFKASDYKKIALIESSVPGVNNLLPPGTKVSIVIDHHQANLEEVEAEYIDIRPNIGATATIMTKYLQELEIPIKTELATALLYGIKVDTNDFRRNTDPADMTAAAYLFPLANHDILNRIEAPSKSTESIDILGEAIKNRQIKGSYLISNVGTIRDRDTLAQAADYMLTLEGITTTLVFGLSEDTIYISGRSRDDRINIGKILTDAFGADKAGGHASLAGAQIPLGVFSGTKDKQTLLKLAEEAVVKRFLTVIGMKKETN